MPIKKSAVKELRKTKKRTVLNHNKEQKIKDTVKKIRKAVIAKNLEEAKKLASEAVVLIDKATKRKIFHKNAAARKKSRIFKAIKKAA